MPVSLKGIVFCDAADKPCEFFQLAGDETCRFEVESRCCHSLARDRAILEEAEGED